MSTKNLIDTILDLWDMFSSGFDYVYSVFSSSLSSLIGNLKIPLVTDILDFVVVKLGIGDYTLLMFMFGLGLPLLIAISVIKWFVDIVL